MRLRYRGLLFALPLRTEALVSRSKAHHDPFPDSELEPQLRPRMGRASVPGDRVWLALGLLVLALPGTAVAQPAQPALTPPRVLEAVDPTYPAEEIGSGRRPVVVLHVTIDSEGRVHEAHVDDTAGEAFDRAALEAIQHWRFEPARRDGQPIAARVRLEVHFAVPELHLPGSEVEPVEPAPPPGSEGPSGPAEGEDEDEDEPVPPPPGAAGSGEGQSESSGAPPDAGAEQAEDASPPANRTADAESAGTGGSDEGSGATEGPSNTTESEEASSEESPQPAVTETTEASDEPTLGVEAHLQREEAEAPRTSSEHVVDRALIEAAPRRDVGDILNSVPAMFTARVEGDAVAHRIMLRGFDAEHGQDIELTVEGVPINLPSHIHGQGYADLNFAMPEVIRALQVTEGVYRPSQGDFAVAGSIDFRLGVQERDRGMTSRTTYGSFNTFRQLLLFAPRGMSQDTFGAASYRHSDGFGQGRASESGDAILSIGFGDSTWHGRVFGIAHGARASLAGVLRAADIQSGRVGFYDRYQDPVAAAQSALAVRFILGASLEHRGDNGEHTRATLWTSYDDFRLQESFTGYTQRSQVMPQWVGRGDSDRAAQPDHLARPARAAPYRDRVPLRLVARLARARPLQPRRLHHAAAEPALPAAESDLGSAGRRLDHRHRHRRLGRPRPPDQPHGADPRWGARRRALLRRERPPRELHPGRPP